MTVISATTIGRSSRSLCDSGIGNAIDHSSFKTGSATGRIDFRRLDLVGDALLNRFSLWIRRVIVGVAAILEAQGIDVFERAFFGGFDNPTAHFDPAIGIGRI